VDRSTILPTETSNCTPGATEACVGPSDCSGARTCLDTGDAFSDCACAADTGSGGSTSFTNGTPGEMGAAGSASPMQGESSSEACVPGSTRTCVGPGACDGLQICEPVAAFSACECSSPARRGLVAAACNADLHCAPGLFCELPSTSNGAFASGGPPAGYCTATCTTNEGCLERDPEAGCYAPGGVEAGPGYCLKTCSLEADASPTQCDGRSDLACVAPASGAPSFCYPVCHDDAHCGGNICNHSTGLCVSSLPEGKPIGAPCADDVECRGRWCISIAGQRRACSGLCVYGAVGGCGFSEGGFFSEGSEETAGRDAACLTPRTPELPASILQLGWCSELCDTDADCTLSTSGWVCEPWPKGDSATLRAEWGRNGACVQPTSGACSDDCEFALDDYCDDGGPDVADPLFSLCDLGTDCTDCGPR
jgi:hypothetical protein